MNPPGSPTEEAARKWFEERFCGQNGSQPQDDALSDCRSKFSGKTGTALAASNEAAEVGVGVTWS